MNPYQLQRLAKQHTGDLRKAVARARLPRPGATDQRADLARRRHRGDGSAADWLTNRVAADLELESAAAALAARLAAQLPLAGQRSEASHRRPRLLDADPGFRAAVEEQVRCLTSEDFKEARRALNKGRSPTDKDAEGDSS
jgi:enoyl-CoA hydratase/carnithine racemase